MGPNEGEAAILRDNGDRQRMRTNNDDDAALLHTVAADFVAESESTRLRAHESRKPPRPSAKMEMYFTTLRHAFQSRKDTK